jgi:pimeloyl-ACP methyl ester carboxylesterase
MDLREISIHGQRITYCTAGSGPVLLLIHGIAGSATTWRQVMPGLAHATASRSAATSRCSSPTRIRSAPSGSCS